MWDLSGGSGPYSSSRPEALEHLLRTTEGVMASNTIALFVVELTSLCHRLGYLATITQVAAMKIC